MAFTCEWSEWKFKFKATKCVIYRSLLGWAFCQEPVGRCETFKGIHYSSNEFVNYLFRKLVSRLVPENMYICDELTICWSNYLIDSAESCVAVNDINYHIRFSASHLQSCQHGAMERYNAKALVVCCGGGKCSDDVDFHTMNRAVFNSTPAALCNFHYRTSFIHEHRSTEWGLA